MHPNGDLTPLGTADDDAVIADTLIENNEIVLWDRSYCSGGPRHLEPCTSSLYCAPGVCGGAQEVDLINVNVTRSFVSASTTAASDWSAMRYPNPTIRNNVLLTSARASSAVVCVGCEATTIENNCIAPHSGSIDDEVSGCHACVDTTGPCVPPPPLPVEFEGVSVDVLAAGLDGRPTPWANYTFRDNVVVGDGNGAGLLIQSNQLGSRDVVILRNHLDGWRADPSRGIGGAVHVRGFDNVTIVKNEINGPCDPSRASICTATDGAGIYASGYGMLTNGVSSSGLVVEGNDIRHLRLTPVFAGGSAYAALIVRGYDGPADAFDIRKNRFACIEGAALVRLGYPSFRTRHGALDVPSVGTGLCHAALSATTTPLACPPSANEPALFHVCGTAFTGGPVPASCTLQPCPAAP